MSIHMQVEPTVFNVSHTTKSFTENLRRIKIEIEKGHAQSILVNRVHYIAMRAGEVENLKQTAITEVAFLNNPKAKKQRYDIVFSPAKLEKILSGLTDHTTETICFLGEQPISFLTRQAYEQMIDRKIRRERRQQSRADRNNDPAPGANGVKYTPANGTTLVEQENPQLVQDIIDAANINLPPETDIDTTAPAIDVIAAENEELASPPEIQDSGSEPTETPAEIEISHTQGPPTDGQDTKKEDPSFPIVEKLSHWDNLRANHREEDFVNSVTLHRGRIVGALMRGSLADTLKLDSMNVLSEREVEWATHFRDNHTGHKCLLEVSGLTPYHGEILFYASLGFMMKHEDQFKRLIAPELWSQVTAAYKEAVREIIPAYWQQENALSLGVFHARKKEFVGVVNGDTPKDLTALHRGKPAALLDTKMLKAIVIPGVLDSAQLETTHVDVRNFPAAWQEKRDNFPSDQSITLTHEGRSVTFVSPKITTDAVLGAFSTLSPSTAEMAEAMKSYKVKSDLRVDRKPEPVEAPVVSAPAPKPAAPTPVAPLTPQDNPRMEQDKNLLQQMAIVARALSTVKNAQNEIIAQTIAGNNIVIFGEALSGKFNETTLQEFAEVYNALKNDSDPELSLTVEPYEGSVTEKARLLGQAFDATKDGHNLVILKTPQATMMVGNNKAFTDFIQDFKL